MSLTAQIDAGDIGLLSTIESQTTCHDRRSLLALHAACASAYARFAYLEIGSHLGGSLQALVRDPRCAAIVSIDSRPKAQPDQRGIWHAYTNNSTQQMLELLGGLEQADLAKVTTLDATTDAIRLADIPIRPQICLIDGEHTNTAAVRDARFCRQLLRDEGVLVFHDTWIVYVAIRTVLCGARGRRDHPTRAASCRTQWWRSSRPAAGPYESSCRAHGARGRSRLPLERRAGTHREMRGDSRARQRVRRLRHRARSAARSLSER